MPEIAGALSRWSGAVSNRLLIVSSSDCLLLLPLQDKCS
jgi:hypothetical protein